MTSWLMRDLVVAAAGADSAAGWRSFVWSLAVRSTLVLLLAFGLNGLWRRASAAVRHRIWVSLFCGLLALPPLSLVMPAWRVPPSVGSQSHAPVVFPAAKMSTVKAGAQGNHPTVSPVKEPQRESSSVPVDISQLALLVWAAGCALVILRLMMGSIRVGRMAKGAKPVTNLEWTGMLRVLTGQLRLKRAPGLAQCEEATMPMAWGVSRPIILLPNDVDRWSRERMQIVLCHELAHIQRRDCLTQLLGEVACAVYWFNPLVWMAARRLRRESERACDDRVLSLGTGACDYAGHLLDLARTLRAPAASWAAAVAMARPSQLESRMVSILDVNRDRRGITRRKGWTITLIFAGLILPMAALRGAANADTGKISGRIFDPSGAVVPAAMVTATNLDTHTRQAITASEAGEFEFPAIAPGKYQMEISKPGFGFFRRENVVVKPHEDARFDVVLQVGLVVQNIDVVAKGRRKNATEPRPAPKRIRVGGNLQAAHVLTQVKPVYPEEALAQGIEGTVLLDAVISMEGNVLSGEVINNPDPRLAKAALDAVKQWHYQPTLLNGQPIEVVTTITVRFHLED
jgi:TonB family protein